MGQPDDCLSCYYKKLDTGETFQDFVMEKLHEIGITIMNYGSKKYQHTKGENLAGIEIKKDQKFTTTGNLYIEIAEKAKAENPNFVRSGIYRNDNTWLYIIGDETCFYIFGKKFLQLMHKTDRYEEKGIATSKGFLIPLGDAEKYCLKKMIFQQGGPSEKSKADETNTARPF